jgi:ABC-type branched-subunit amino acid transport system ATPase component
MMDIVVENVHSGYGNGEVLCGLSMTVQSGSILGVMGRNGMGKSTLVRTMAGLNKTISGKITMGGRDITDMPPHARARMGLSTIVQGRGIFPLLTVRENLEMGRLCADAGLPSRLDEVLGYFTRLGERMDQRAGTMSGGEQQMLAIGRGLMMHPKVMLLDEPSDGIMPVLVTQIADILVEINKAHDLTIMVVEQNVPMVFRMTERCMIIENGRVVVEGLRSDLEKSDVMQEYLAI